MVRQLLVPALLAALLVPDWATAFQPCVPCPAPVYLPPCTGPVVVYGPVGDCVPTAGTVSHTKPPTVVPERMEPTKKPQVQADPPKEMPAKAEEPAAPAPKPAPLPPVKTEEKSVPLPPVTFAEPKVDPKPEPKQVVPPMGERIPAPAVPPAPAPKPELTPFDIPPIGGDVPPAKPQPAEATPAKPEPVKPADKPKEPEKLPGFSFDVPKGDMAQPVEANKKTVSNSSPLSDKPSEVDVYPRDGKDVGSAKRSVQFVNKSARDILLTVDGHTTTLPSKMVMEVQLPAAFKWQIGGEAERSEKVPDGSPGVDVVIRK
jgi:hypothetical protein